MNGSRALVALTSIAATFVVGCDLANDGVPLPPAQLNFPIALATSGEFLIVANANADARYNSGSLQSWRLPTIRERVAALVATGECGGVDQAPCELLIEGDPQAFLVSEVQIGTHADGLAISPRGDRVYLPIRSGRGVLTWVDLDPEGGLHCGDEDASGIPRCDDAHRGADVAPSASDLELPTDPTTVTVIPSTLLGLTEADPDAILVMHRVGAASLFLDDHVSRPRLFDVQSNMPTDVVSAELDPTTGLVWLTAAPAASRATRDIVAVAPIVSGASASIAIVQRLTVSGVDDGIDMRDIAFDPSGERAWLLSRRPEAVLTLDFTLDPIAAGEAPLGEIHAVASGPSRIVRIEVPYDGGGGGAPVARTYLVASCYEANRLSVVDPQLGVIATVAGLAGPFEMAFDSFADAAGATNYWMYVINYRDNTIAVVDFTPLTTGASPRLIATLGDRDSPSPF